MVGGQDAATRITWHVVVTGQIVPVKYVTGLKHHRVTAVSLQLSRFCRGRILTRILGGEKLGRLIDFNSHI